MQLIKSILLYITFCFLSLPVINSAAKIVIEPETGKENRIELLDKLIKAIQKKNKGKVSELLEHDIDLNSEYGPNGSTPLMYAAEAGNIEISHLLLTKHVDINKQNNKKTTALQYAIYFTNLEMVDLLLKKGAYIDRIKRKDKYSILGFAFKQYAIARMSKDRIKSGNLYEIIKLLIKSNVFVPKDVITYFLEREDNVILSLISRQAEQTLFNFSSIGLAIIDNNEHEIKMIIENGGPNLDVLLLSALTYRKPEIIKLLINKGAKFESVYFEEDDPLTIVIKSLEMINEFKKIGMPAAITDLVSKIIKISVDESVDTVKILLNKGIAVEPHHLEHLANNIEALQNELDNYSPGAEGNRELDNLISSLEAHNEILKLLKKEKERRVLLTKYKKMIEDEISKKISVSKLCELITSYSANFQDEFISLEALKTALKDTGSDHLIYKPIDQQPVCIIS